MIIGIDPGETTGWATWTARKEVDGNETTYSNQEWYHDQIGPEDHHLELYRRLQSADSEFKWPGSLQIVCESFEFRNTSRTGTLLNSCEYIGVVNLFHQWTSVPVAFQTASQGKVRNTASAFVKPANLRKLGLWFGVENKHAHDAIGHMLYWMVHTGHINRLELLRKGWQ